MSDARLAIGQQAYRYFLERGLPPHQAAAFAGNVAWESGGRTDGINIGDNRKYPAAPHSFGISQWNGDRLARLVDYARSQGADIPAGSLADPNYLRAIAPKLPLETQLGYAWQEMQGPEAKALAATKGAGDIRSATASALGFYRPLGWHPTTPEAGHGFPGRLALASKIMASAPGEPPAPAATAPATPVMDDLTRPPISAAGGPPPAAAPMAPPASERPPAAAPAGPASILDAIAPDLSKTIAGLLGGGGEKAAPTTVDPTDAKIADAINRERERNAPQEDPAAMDQMAPLSLVPRRAARMQLAEQQQMRAPMRLGIFRS